MPTFSTNDPHIPAVDAEATGFGTTAITAVAKGQGVSEGGNALHAVASSSSGTIFCESNLDNGIALFARCNKNGTAAHFESPNDEPHTGFPNVRCLASNNEALFAHSGSNHGVHGISGASQGTPVFPTIKAGVFGESSQSVGVLGLATRSPGNIGVFGAASQDGTDFDPAKGGTGVFGTGYIGVRGETQTGVAVLGRTFGRGLAGRFVGDIEVTGRINHGGP